LLWRVFSRKASTSPSVPSTMMTRMCVLSQSAEV
jgi:hypothetical protein